MRTIESFGPFRPRGRRLASLLLVLFAAVFGAMERAQGTGVQLTCGTFELDFDSSGKPLSLHPLPAGYELLNTSAPGAGFLVRCQPDLTSTAVTDVPLSVLTLSGTTLTANSADGKYGVTFQVMGADKYITFRIAALSGIPADPAYSLHFDLAGGSSVRVFELDYMTSITNYAYSVAVDWYQMFDQSAANPLGGFALYVHSGDNDEDDTILRIWGNEGLPHPIVSGTWNYAAAQAWVNQWMNAFPDRSRVILNGTSVSNLEAAVPYAKQVNASEIYLYTDVWRGGFWPTVGNYVVNTAVFPNGMTDMKAFADYCRSQSLGFAVHFLPPGLGFQDPIYVTPIPDQRMATWCSGSLAAAVSSTNTDIQFSPAPGTVYPLTVASNAYRNRPGTYPTYFTLNYVRIDNELVYVGQFQNTGSSVWLLHNVTRGKCQTTRAAHAVGAGAQGLICAYGQVFQPANDSTLLDTLVQQYASMVNLCQIDQVVYDGAEDQTFDGQWGFNKVASKVYALLDHPVKAGTSSGAPPACHIEYRLNAIKRLTAGDSWCLPFNLDAQGSQPAMDMLQANWALSQGAVASNGQNPTLGIQRQTAQFDVSASDFATHGLTTQAIALVNNWRTIGPRITQTQRAQIQNSIVSGSSALVYVLQQTGTTWQIVPTQVLVRASGDSPWHWGTESGPFGPKQQIHPGDTLQLQNPFAAQPMTFVLRVEAGQPPLVNPVITAGSSSLSVTGTLNAGEYLAWSGSGAAARYDLNWNQIATLPVVTNAWSAPMGWFNLTLTAASGTGTLVDTRFMTQGTPMAIPNSIQQSDPSYSYVWNGISSGDWSELDNWVGLFPPTLPPRCNGAFADFLTVNGVPTLAYTAAQGTTVYASAGSALKIGVGTPGSMTITGGTFSTFGSSGADLIGSASVGTLTIAGGAFVGSGAGTNLGTSSGYAGYISTLNVNGGSATTGTIAMNAGVATVNLNGGILAASRISRSSGTANLNFNGGTLQALQSDTQFLSGLTAVTVLAGGATIDTQGFAVTIGSSLMAGGGGGGLTKIGAGTLTLSGSNTYSGVTTVAAGLIQLGSAEIAGTSGPLGNPATPANSIVLSGGGLQFSSANSYDYTTSGRLQVADGSTGTIDTNGQNVKFSSAIGVGPGKTGALIKQGMGTLTLSATNTYSGGTTLTAGQLSLGNASAIGPGPFTIFGGAIDNASGSAMTLPNAQFWNGDFTFVGSNALNLGTTAVTLGENRTVTVNGSTLTVGGAIGDGGNGYSLAKQGAGTLTLTGISTYTGATAVNGGTLDIGGGGATGAISSSSALSLGGGTLKLTVSSGNVTQSFAGTTIAAGASSIQNTLSGNTLALGAVSRRVGGRVDFTITGRVSTSTGNTNGILGGWATVGGTSWAVVGAGNYIAALSSYYTTTAGGNAPANYASSSNVDITSSPTLGGVVAVNTLRFNTNAAETLSLAAGNNAVSTGGILVTSNVGNNLSTIAGGTLMGASGQDLLVLQNNTGNGLTISSLIADNTTATALTKAGAGTLTLTNANTFSGGVTVNGGALLVNNVNALGTGTLTINSGAANTLHFSTNGTVANPMNINEAFTITNDGSNSLTLAGNITGNSGSVLVGNATASGTITLTGSNRFNGDFYAPAGTYRLGSNYAAGGVTWRPNIATKIILLDGVTCNSGMAQNISWMGMDASGTASFTGGVWPVGAYVVDTPAGAQLTLAGIVYVSGTLNKTGAGTAILSALYSSAQAVVVSGGVLQASAISPIQTSGSYGTTLDGGALQYAGASGTTSRPLTITANGGGLDASGSGPITYSSTAAVLYTGSGNRALALTGTNTGANTLASGIADNGADQVSLLKNGAGTWVLTGSNSYSGDTELLAGTLSLAQINPAAATSSVWISATAANLNLAFSGTQTVARLFIGGIQQPSGIFTAGDPSGAFSGSGALQVTGGPVAGTYDAFITTPVYGIFGANQNPAVALNEDGLTNLLQYVLNGTPGSLDRSILPTAAIASTQVVFSFHRRTSSAAETTQTFQYSNDLVGWTDVPVTQSALVSITSNTPSAGIDQVVITLPKNGNNRLFGRLKVLRP